LDGNHITRYLGLVTGDAMTGTRVAPGRGASRGAA
jgi:uncharacterized protein YbjQ (UPF0145 family)